MRVELSPRPVPLAKPLTLSVRLSGPLNRRVTAATARIESESMAMGRVELTLARTPGGELVGEGQLPVCVSERMRWRVDLELSRSDAPAAPVAWRFRFETDTAAAGSADGGPGLVESKPQALVAGSGATVDFALRSAKGPVRLSEARGQVALVYFGYTFCPDICPTSLTATARGLNALTPSELERVRAFFVSVDPERDSVEHLARYVAFFHPGIVGLTGTAAELAATARDFGVVYQRHERPGAAYSVDHSAFTAVVSPEGRYVSRLPHAAEPEVLVSEVRRLLSLDAGAMDAGAGGSASGRP